MRKAISAAVLVALSPWAQAQDSGQVREIKVIGVRDTHAVVTDDT
jgi:hypothetical protein